MQRFSAQRPTSHDTLRFWTIDNFPRFADGLLRRQLFLKFRFEAPPAPYSLDENRFEGEGSSEVLKRHKSRQTSNLGCPTSNAQFRAPIPMFLPLNVQCSMLDVRRFRADLWFQTCNPWMKSLFRYWLPLLIWLGVIFVASTNVMSAEHTSRFIVPFLLWLKPGMSPQTIWIVLVVVRKFAHVAEYAILALLLWRAFRSGTALRTKMPLLFGTVLVLCAVFATSDEFHQCFVKSRTPSVRDVLLDVAGALLGLSIGASFAHWNPQKSRTTVQSQFVDAKL